MLKEELITKAKEEGLPVKILEKEALQIYILSELFALPSSTLLTFQGGTCLRLIYNGARYSEDLDFVTTAKKSEINQIISDLEKALHKIEPLFGGKLVIKKQKESSTFYRFRVHNQKEDIHNSFFVSIEFACYPAYTLNIALLADKKKCLACPFILVGAEILEKILVVK